MNAPEATDGAVTESVDAQAKPALEDVLPLTPVQEAIVYHSTRPREQDSHDPYLIIADLDLAAVTPGVIEDSAVRSALETVIARHAMLRASFTRRRTGAPVARVHTDVEVRIDTVDPAESGGPDSLRESLRRQGIPLTTAPPLRAVVARDALAGTAHLLLVVHHVALDGWSLHRVVDEIVHLLRGEPLDPVVPISDFHRWRTTLPNGLDSWRRALTGLPAPTLVPVDPGAAHRSRVISRSLGVEASRRLRTIARSVGASANTLIQVAWALVLADLDDSDDVVFGAVVSGRDPALPGVDEMVGMLINTIPVRVRLDPTETVGELITRLQREQLALLPHHHTALGDIGAATGLGELFNTLLVFESFPRGTVRPHLEDENTYAATVLVEDEPDIRLLLEHRGADPDLLDRLLGMLAALTAAPDTPRGRLPRSDRGDASIVSGSPVTAAEPAAQRIARLAAEQGDAVALLAGEVAVSRRDLDRAAARAAAGLRERGIGTESIVAIHAHRTPELVAVLLAVLRVGAAYLPIDPAYPSARVDFMLTDSRPDLVVDDALVAALTRTAPTPTAPTQTERAAGTEPVSPHPDSAAYLVYTSGSTGTPKAVVGTAGALARRLSWAATDWAAPVILAKSSIAFIDGTTELLGALSAGATVVLASDADLRDAGRLAELAAAHGVRQITAVPSLAHTVVEDGRAPDLDRWIVSGEPLTAAVADALTPHAGEVVNSYGSSEVAGDVTTGAIAREHGGAIHVGTPVPGTRIIVLDHLLRPVPVGTAGEVYVSETHSGAGQLGRGYRAHPEWTATHFVADVTGGARMYRTGDRGLIDTTGRLRLLGRRDTQVKIRGVRVELGEVEAALTAVHGVAQAAVITNRTRDGHHRIHAFVSGTAAPESVTASLDRVLPAAMLPSTITVLDELPLTPGGKVDRRALTAPEDHAPTTGGRTARTNNERLVVTAAGDVLGIDEPAADANFFDLGGHSLSATRLVTRLRVATGRALQVADVFDNPVLADLAGLLPVADGTDATDADDDTSGGSEPTDAERPDPLPLSPAQQRLLFQAGVDDSAYTVAFAVRLDAHAGTAIDAQALRDSLHGIVTRHEVLRTRIVDGHPVIDAPDTVATTLDEHRLEHDPAALDTVMAALIARPFDLARDRVLRADLIALSATASVLLITVHHIAADEWSAGQLFDELASGYSAAVEHRGDRVPVAPVIQFVDHTIRQLARLGDESDPHSLAAGQLSYWREALDGIPDEIAPPLDRARQVEPSHRGAEVHRTLPLGVCHALDRLGAATGTSRFMMVHAAVALSLAASGAGDDIVVGTPIAGRGDAAAEDLIGMFVNTLALRTDLRGDPTLAQVLARVRSADLDAYAHADLPFEQLVAALAPTRSLARHPLFQTMVQYRDPIVAPEFPGLEATPLFPPTRTAKFDLTYEFVGLPDTGDGSGLRLRLEYATDLFDANTAHRLADRAVAVLDALATDPGRRLSRLLMPDAVHALASVRVPDENRSAPESSPGPSSLVEVFTSTVATHPNRVAISDGTTSLTYREIDSRSAQLASQLVADGVTVGDLVALVLPRGADQVIAVLAVLRAGAAYVPIDPAYPAERIETILDDARPTLTVDAEYLTRRASDGPPAERSEITIGARHTAYVIFTSGSTGRPKGVRVTHGNACALLASTRGLFDVGADDVWMLFHSYAFDFSVWEMWGALSTGARLVIADRDTTRSPADLAALIAAEGVTVLNQTPSAFAALDATVSSADETGEPLYDNVSDPTSLSSLRYLVFGGEALDPRRLTGFLRRHPSVRAVNMYGITEITVHATHREIDAAAAAHATGSDVGALLPGFTGRLLDRHLRPVPVGVVGELYLSGPQVTTGYLHRPALSATRFVADPTTPGGLAYRTGDLFRHTATGELHYVGRSDLQVKIRGYRIEPGEVSAAISSLPGVADVATIARPGPDGDHRLLAYVVTAEHHPAGTDLTADSVRFALAQRLPDHLVPGAITLIDRIPLTTNGKTDASALPDPVPPAESGAGREPATETERMMQEIFAETLRIDPASIGVDDDFFALGGDSITSTTMVNRARRRGLRITPRDVFAHRSVAGLAGVAEPIVAPSGGAAEDTAAPHSAPTPVALLPIMHRLRELGGTVDRVNQSLVIDTPPDAGTEFLATALQALLDHHDALRMTLSATAGVWGLAVSPPGSVRATDLLVEMPIDAHGTVADTVTVASDAAAARLAPTRGRMLAVTHLRPANDADAGRLILVIHHLAVDGVSRRILIDDLAAFHSDGRLPTGPDASIADHAAAVAVRAGAPELLGELDHWVRVLAPGGDLLPGVPAAGGVVGDQRRHVVVLDVATSRVLVTEAPAAFGVGVTSIFLGALRIAASAVFDTVDLIVDTERHGRDTEAAGLGIMDLSHTVGWFTTMAPLRLSGPVDDAVDPLGAVRDADRQWHDTPGAGAGYGMLRHLNPQTSAALATMPRASVLLNYLGRFTVGGGGAWQPSAESSSLRALPDPDLGCDHLLEIDVVCRDELDGPVLSATFGYLHRFLSDDAVRRLGEAWADALSTLAALSARDESAFDDSGVPT
ncbi:amino acid adenylation domain-containing protein [Gordonia sp. L191]|uniref:non-ribosomal peptide synthetase n=1 Tax=Gordonia sp. L191 TaxID=2982699 RepID=UPI0024C05AE7|nr:non-ribosomal peptide synthetase [Gordonia sp. L191]WHU49508.1 amino acid adenylation domain-containing protein [Gordonia sp. L191]